MDKLIALNTVGFTLFTEINKLVQTSTNISKIRGFLDAHGLLEAKDKEIVSNLVSSKAIKDPEIQFSSLEKELSALNLAINDYLVELKINRKRMEE